jgi:catalase (peroxidase I)
VDARRSWRGAGTVPDAHDPTSRHAPMMSTADLALRMDPAYEPISRRFHEHPATSSPTPSPAPGSS